MIAVLLSFFFIGRHIGTSSAFVKEADRGFQVISAHNPFELKKNAIIVIFEKSVIWTFKSSSAYYLCL